MEDNSAGLPKLAWIKSAKGVTEVYANATHITWSLDDVRLRLGQVVENPDTPSPGADFQGVIEERAAVTVTWRNAKVAAIELTRAVQHYEEVNGEINIRVMLPPSIP